MAGTLSLIFLAPSDIYALASYDIDLIGLYDDEVYTASPNAGNYVGFLGDNGYVSGITFRFQDVRLGQAAWLYNGANTYRLGYFDGAFTRSDGYQYSTIYGMTEDGRVVGSSREFLDARRSVSIAWINEDTGIRQIGLTDAVLAGTGFHNQVIGLNDNAQVIGYASDNQITASWLYRDGETIRTGLYGEEHTNPLTGGQDSRAYLINSTGQVTGTSTRYYQNPVDNSVVAAGQSAWLYDGEATVELGFLSDEYLLDGVTRDSSPYYINNAGQVTGYSTRFIDGAYAGRAAWLQSGVETLRIGLYDSRFTAPVSGQQFTEIKGMNDAGQVVGESTRYYSEQNTVPTAWISDGQTTTALSLRGSMYDINSDIGYSIIVDINQAGDVVGNTASHVNGIDASNFRQEGYSAWIYRNGSIQRIGLLDEVHHGDYADHSSFIVALNEQGQVIGTSRVFEEGPAGGGFGSNAAWLFDGQQTIEIGLRAEDPLSTGESYSNRPMLLNEQGQVAGSSLYVRDDSGIQGSSAWFYDPGLDTTFEMLFSERSDGYSYSGVGYLSEDGTLLGEYLFYDEHDSYTNHLYMFTVDEGFFDLGELFVNEQDTIDWVSLNDLILANDGGFLAGQGIHSEYGPAAFVMSPVVVPVPPAAWLFVSGLLGMVGAAKRQKKLRSKLG